MLVFMLFMFVFLFVFLATSAPGLVSVTEIINKSCVTRICFLCEN